MISRSSDEPISRNRLSREFASCDCQDASEVAALLEQVGEARDYIERVLNRTILGEVCRVASTHVWPWEPVWFDYPPLRSVDEVAYLADDTANTHTVVNPTQYRIIESTDGRSFLEFVDDFQAPNHATRSDAIQITYTTGYDATIGNDVPPTIKSAIILQTRLLYDPGGQSESSLRRSIDDLLAAVDWGQY